MGNTVVVLGAGAGGLAAAQQLRARLPASDRIVLIDRSFTGSLGLSALRVLAGWRSPDQIVTEVTALPGVELLTGEVTGIDPDAKTVHYQHDDGAESIDYQALLIALGAGLDTAALPGLPDAIARGVAGEFYTPGGAATLRRRVQALESGRIVVLIPSMPFKCPPAPYEAAFLIADQLRGKVEAGAIRVDVITAEPRPIPVVGPEVGAALRSLLDAAGIGFQPGRTARLIAERTVVFTDDSAEPFDLLAVVPPHSSVVAQLLPHGVDAAGWIPVDAATLATALPAIWAVGDNTALTLANGRPLPKAGIFAAGAADVVADQIARHLGYDVTDVAFTAEGACYMEVGGGLAAKVAGRFLADPAPKVALYEPSAAFHTEKARLEQDWLDRWGSAS